MTREELMKEIDVGDEEFDQLFHAILDEVQRHGKIGVSKMLAYVEQEINEGRAFID